MVARLFGVPASVSILHQQYQLKLQEKSLNLLSGYLGEVEKLTGPLSKIDFVDALVRSVCCIVNICNVPARLIQNLAAAWEWMRF